MNFPGPISQQMLDELQRYVIADPYPFVLDLEHCHGMWLVTMDDEEVFDWAGYFGSKLLGHHHPRLADQAYLNRLALGFDEVQTAGGQTGTFFVIDQFALPHPPQAVATGKKLGNGAVYMLHPMRDRGILDSTWGGSLADMVRFVEEMKIVQEKDLVAQVPAKAAHLEAGLCGLAERFGHLIFNPRGMGLYQGFTVRHAEWEARLIETALQDENMLLLGAGRYSVRLRPPIDVTIADIDEMLSRLARAMQRLSDEVAATCGTAA